METSGPAELVRQRIEFVEIIGELNEQFLDPRLIRKVGDCGWTHPWKYFDSLRNYLLLTCFDLLGQPDQFMDFGRWLQASSAKEERDAIVDALDSGSELIQSMKSVHDKYLKIYGAKRAFYRFVEELLPTEVADALYYSVRIRKIDPEKNIELEKIDAPKKKLAFLYLLRNNYTHSGVITGSPAGGVFRHWGKPVVIDGTPMLGWELIHYEERGKLRFEYSVRDWPKVLIDVIRSGISDGT